MKKETSLQRERRIRAVKYALAMVCYQDVGMGADEMLYKTRDVISAIQYICEYETGFKLEGYPTDFLKKNKDVLDIPYTLQKLILADKTLLK